MGPLTTHGPPTVGGVTPPSLGPGPFKLGPLKLGLRPCSKVLGLAPGFRGLVPGFWGLAPGQNLELRFGGCLRRVKILENRVPGTKHDKTLGFASEVASGG